MDNTQQISQMPLPGQTPVMGATTAPNMGSTGGVNAAQNLGVEKKDNSGLIKTIVIIIVSLIAVTFVGLFIWMFTEYNAARTDVDGQIAKAVAEAKDTQAMELEAEFAEREKEPYREFAGPADYGQLSFKYPKTWSLYVASDASKGGDYQAYFNPIEVEAISNTAIYALRVTIRDKDFESVSSEYQRYVNQKDATLSVSSMTINGATANYYTGTIPGTEHNGLIVIFKIRDKTAVLQTDAVLFQSDFEKILETVKFNA